ncbi:hypothetical protein A3K73_01890 [Candidatus Pacearchaeota archaeon RBG_13_36_9]|nr:MAG: hypothetical protein A3K73_01890 [Candidatus Pacearchaeota archaeon RBG_13_36_9]
MNKRASFAAVIVVVLLVVVGVGGYYFIRPFFQPQVTGASVSSYSPSSSQPSSSNPNNPYGVPEYKNTGKGDYGQPCLDNGLCDAGECQGGMCVHCGYFGETCCYNDVAGTQCEKWSECYLGRCRVTDEYTQDCGHIGYKPCYYNEYAKCYYGVYNSYFDICEACGDYEQPCCPDTVYECDYGQCINGRCKKVDNPAASSTPTTPSQSSIDSQDTPAYDPYGYQPDSQEQAGCGHLDQDCCKNMQQFTSFCYDGLDCRADICVNSPDYEAYDRSDREQY